MMPDIERPRRARRRPCGTGHRGFTLVEVLVALAIVTVGLAALFTTANQTVRTSSYLRERTLAQWIALNRITETRLSGRIPSDEEMEGETEYGGERWRWKLLTVKTPVEGIFRLEAFVAPEEAAEDSWPGQATGFMGKAMAPPNIPAVSWLGNPAARGQQPPAAEQPPPETRPPGDEPQPTS